MAFRLITLLKKKRKLGESGNRREERRESATKREGD
jgi:hypothetical protein